MNKKNTNKNINTITATITTVVVVVVTAVIVVVEIRVDCSCAFGLCCKAVCWYPGGGGAVLVNYHAHVVALYQRKSPSNVETSLRQVFREEIATIYYLNKVTTVV